MPRFFLFHLLESWLLLSQLTREIHGQEMEIFTKCNIELVRFWVHTCGTQLWAEEMRKNQRLRAERSAEIMPSSTTKDAETLNKIMDFVPTLPQELKKTLSERPLLLKELRQAASKDINLNFEEFKENSLNRQSKAEHKSLSALKNIRLVKHFLKKRQAPYLLSVKCCYTGCTKKEVAVFC
ncbi:prorelaxin-like [Saccopteryx leptura]|uniref:prorelaxin-like n=1 Tax=Saccopteryx leptura TaxID=249018 RepID=UPI00339BAB64